MSERSFPVCQAAALVTILAAACNDSPLAPRNENSPSPTPIQAGVRVFAGRSADSVIRAFDAVWARGNQFDYRETRRAWRKANGIPDSVGDPRFTPVPFTPNALLTDGNDGSWMTPPQILAHSEAFHFGEHDQRTNAPDAIEGELTFVGDQANVSATITVTKNDGASSTYATRIAQGPGTFVGCTDVGFGNCANRRWLNGAMTLTGAPTCAASASGTVSYYVSNVNATVSGAAGSGGNNTASASASGGVSGTASACSSEDDGGQQTADSTSATPTAPSGPVGVPSAPPPPPSGPNAPSSPPIGGGTTITTFHCDRNDVYVNGTLFDTTITCYPS